MPESRIVDQPFQLSQIVDAAQHHSGTRSPGAHQRDVSMRHRP
jgi:hypothetical protein